jgi:uncharacterized protein
MSRVNTKQQLIETLLSHKEQIQAFGVRKIGFFGSFVRDEANEESDVDFFVDFDPQLKTLENFVGLAHYLQALLNRKVEIVTPQSLNRFTGKYIIQQVEYVPFAA